MASASQPQYPIDLGDVAPDHYAAIGEVIARWSWIEFQLGVIIRVGFRLGKTEGRVLTGGMAAKVLAGIVSMLARQQRNPAIRAQLEELTERFTAQINRRNDLAHGLFGYLGKNTAKIVRYEATKSEQQRVRPNPAPEPVENIRATAAELREIQNLAKKVTDALKAQLRAHV